MLVTTSRTALENTFRPTAVSLYRAPFRGIFPFVRNRFVILLSARAGSLTLHRHAGHRAGAAECSTEWRLPGLDRDAHLTASCLLNRSTEIAIGSLAGNVMLSAARRGRPPRKGKQWDDHEQRASAPTPAETVSSARPSTACKSMPRLGAVTQEHAEAELARFVKATKEEIERSRRISLHFRSSMRPLPERPGRTSSAEEIRRGKRRCTSRR